MFENEKILPYQNDKNKDKIEQSEKPKDGYIRYDCDSSPKAWAHYKKYYKDNFGNVYQIVNPKLFNQSNDVETKRGFIKGKKDFWLYKYTKEQRNIKKSNRLYALEIIQEEDYESTDNNNKTWYKAIPRLGGDCDFNFKEDTKYQIFYEIISNDTKDEKKITY